MQKYTLRQLLYHLCSPSKSKFNILDESNYNLGWTVLLLFIVFVKTDWDGFNDELRNNYCSQTRNELRIIETSV